MTVYVEDLVSRAQEQQLANLQSLLNQLVSVSTALAVAYEEVLRNGYEPKEVDNEARTPLAAFDQFVADYDLD